MHSNISQAECDAVERVIRTRRSVRRFTDESIPEETVRRCLEWGLLAPNSSNLQPWRIHWVRSADTKAKLAHACLDQASAQTASDLIVVTVLPGIWRKHAQWNLDNYPVQPPPPLVRRKFTRIVPLMYSTGPFGILAPFKWLLFTLMALRGPMVREPLTPKDLRLWAAKTAALACQNILLAFRAHGFDTCPMEGFDAPRVKRLLGLTRKEYIVLVIAAGRRAEDGVDLPQYRIHPDELINRH